MSVFVVMRVKGDPDNFVHYAQDNADMMRRIAGVAEGAGAKHHSFAAGDNEVVVVDEWPSAEAFQQFFTSQPEIPKLMREGGAQGTPEVSIYRKLDTPDAF